MTKLDFITELSDRLSGLPQGEVDERISFYAEIIDEYIEDGLDEEEAVARIGSINEIVDQIIDDVPFTTIAKEKIKKKRRLSAFEIVLLAVGSPLWISLGAVALAVFLSLYAVLWSLVAVAWSVFACFTACAPVSIALGVLYFVLGKPIMAICAIGAGLFLAGLSIFSFFGCKAATKGCAVLTKRIALGIKKCLVRKERTNG